MASKASMAAYGPGTETSARLAPPAATARPRVRGEGASPKPPAFDPADLSEASAPSRAASPAATASWSSALIATTSSLGWTPSGTEKPIPPITSRLSSVAIATWAAVTPGAPATWRETCMRLTES